MSFNQERVSEDKLVNKRHNAWKLTLPLICAVVLTCITSIALFVNNPQVSYGVSKWAFEKSNIVKRSINFIYRGKQPLGIHSHNDYLRSDPLFDSLIVGAKSVEADVWSFDNGDVLPVGHTFVELNPFENTLEKLYTKPLLELLDAVNRARVEGEPPVGIFPDFPSETFYLHIDVKNDPDQVFDKIQKHLYPLQQKGYLTTFETVSQKWNHGPITVVLTGDYPLKKILDQKVRNVFADAPLNDLVGFKATITSLGYNGPLSIYSVAASASFFDITGSLGLPAGGLSDRGRRDVQRVIDKAHSFGLKTRIWETPNYPTEVRDLVWRDLISMGTDLLNVDDLTAASKMFNLQEP
ncbi:uncharacterized protein CYBJADRAFT_129263 [Cyberlindnera jadinii NRRL Y-1542]|uniref:Altered inheritance of mitochondria protein 6 n=1 Tax=Cyberlindnera jadinii (strain ATCC 18201 / CBS 1600 / BCRC 20928 / JCM 3617 / NBRC 0987 / NRRL Y-1542) TaxID=983966 RepID=A0A1E4RZA1_CYBJN|nr:hypothetical protein CYBJADRAFT_129263 [Cyberlindnera jadinii NRRL Y-1542]ODV72551.1 hypothetical protein CYBJADRAFT_129263 [Cyberlindnera jadinii NRRL Y-1542]